MEWTTCNVCQKNTCSDCCGEVGYSSAETSVLRGHPNALGCTIEARSWGVREVEDDCQNVLSCTSIQIGAIDGHNEVRNASM